jgi:hypothetical protein
MKDNEKYLQVQDVWILRKPMNGRYHFSHKGSANMVGLPSSTVGGDTLEDLASWVENNYSAALARAKSVDFTIPQSYIDSCHSKGIEL